MAGAADIEQIWQDFQSEKFTLIGIDAYNGNQAQVLNAWGERASYPLLLKGASLAREFALSTEAVFVLDHAGQLQYRHRSFKPIDRLRAAVEDAVGLVPDPEPQVQSAVRQNSWGRIKTERP